jgi:hypothetical protein
MMAKVKTKALAVVEPKPTLNIIDMLDGVFQPWFPGESWNGWRAVLKAVYGLPMTDSETTFFQSVAGDRLAPTQTVREFWAICARRAGKDSVVSAIAAFAGATFSRQDKLRPGERGVVMCLAVDRDHVLNYIRSYFTDIPLLKGMVTRETSEGFELNNQVDIVVVTNNFRSIRGRAVLLCIMDECAYWRDENSSKPDEELYRAVTPALASLAPDSMIIGISSPYKRSGLLYKKWKTHFAQDGDRNDRGCG